MPSNAPPMPKAGPITSAGWPRSPPDATRAPTPGAAATAVCNRFPRDAGDVHSIRADCCGYQEFGENPAAADRKLYTVPEGADLPPIIKRKKQRNNPAGYRCGVVPPGQA